ncbi:hypothetical protein SKAU_G00326920 [Synaphobranchus kaupii]|uniref:Uncharacterized protein n=1 Tax=Synaphobranchus kaupii TaxID=118154 RepID=A0A9Q1IKG5_SYNKA|nr:hypothetical protein SKAU_G00326920 [Synaphobranchus kaupii]
MPGRALHRRRRQAVGESKRERVGKSPNKPLQLQTRAQATPYPPGRAGPDSGYGWNNARTVLRFLLRGGHCANIHASVSRGQGINTSRRRLGRALLSSASPPEPGHT